MLCTIYIKQIWILYLKNYINVNEVQDSTTSHSSGMSKMVTGSFNFTSIIGLQCPSQVRVSKTKIALLPICKTLKWEQMGILSMSRTSRVRKGKKWVCNSHEEINLQSSFSLLVFWWLSQRLLYALLEYSGSPKQNGSKTNGWFIKESQPTLFMIIETHTTFDRTRAFWNHVDYSKVEVIEAQGQSGGLWILMQNGCTLSISVVDVHPNAITVTISFGPNSWTCTGLYASLISARRFPL